MEIKLQRKIIEKTDNDKMKNIKIKNNMTAQEQ